MTPELPTTLLAHSMPLYARMTTCSHKGRLPLSRSVSTLTYHRPRAFNAPVRSDDDLLAQRATATVAQRFNSHLPPPSRAFAPLLTWPQPGLFLLRPQEPKGGAVPSPSSRLLSFAPVPSKSHLARGASANRSSRLRGAGCRRPPRCQEAGDGFAWHRKRQVLTPGRGGDPAGLT